MTIVSACVAQVWCLGSADLSVSLVAPGSNPKMIGPLVLLRLPSREGFPLIAHYFTSPPIPLLSFLTLFSLARFYVCLCLCLRCCIEDRILISFLVSLSHKRTGIHNSTLGMSHLCTVARSWAQHTSVLTTYHMWLSYLSFCVASASFQFWQFYSVGCLTPHARARTHTQLFSFSSPSFPVTVHLFFIYLWALTVPTLSLFFGFGLWLGPLCRCCPELWH